MKSNGFIKLRICGQNLKPEDISEKLSQQPSFSYHKGDSFTPKYGNKQSIAYEEDCWLLEMEKDESQTFDEAIYKLLSKFKGSTGYLKELSSEFDVVLWVSVYPDEEQISVNLSPNTLKLIADMGISVDFDILYLKEFYDGSYRMDF